MGWHRHHHGPHERCRHAAPRGGLALAHYVRSRLHRKLFMWFGASIVMTGVVVVTAASFALSGAADTWRDDSERFALFVGNRFAERWHDPTERAALARAISTELDVNVNLVDPAGAELERFGALCASPHHRVELRVPAHGAELGRVRACWTRDRGARPGWILAMAVLAMLAMLWAASGVIARRLMRPLEQVVETASEIGRGKLSTRVRLGRHRVGEIGILADAIDDMATRIEKQLADQRELLAAVSHEIRTPLGHIRVLLETASAALEQERPLSPEVLAEVEREVLEIDDLVGELLASSRLSFDSLERRPLEALDVAARALERCGLPLELLASDEESVPFQGDATLLGRALANLVENARRHGQAVERVCVQADAEWVTFAVEDAGPGFAEDERERVFESFYRGEHRAGGSLGLGLSLVRRIAEAHGGRAWAENRTEGGARVSLRVKRA